MSNVTTLKNDTRFDDACQAYFELGADAANGKESLPRFGLKLVRDAADSIIKPGQAQVAYECYLRGYSTKELHEHTKNGLAANVSKVKRIIELGCLPHVDGVGVLDMVVDVRREMKARGVKVKGAYKAFVEAARAQCADPENQLSKAAIEALCDGTPASKDLIDKLIAQYKATARIQEENPTDNMARVVDGLREEIIAQGGEVPAVTKDDKETLKAVALLAKKGIRVAA